MTVFDLNREQLTELKQGYWINTHDEEPDYYTLANIDDFVSDDEVYDEYAGVEFTLDDFDGDYSEAHAPVRIVIDVYERRNIELALGEVMESIEAGDKRALLGSCKYEIQDR